MTEQKKLDLYSLKRNLLKQKREVRRKIMGSDEVDGTSYQRVYSEATKTKRAFKIEHFGSKSKASATEGEETTIEKFVREILDEAGTPYKEQKAIRYINVDFYVASKNLVIQVHGCYWHCCEKCYPAGPKNNIQRKNIEKDKVANEIIQGEKLNLLEIWHHEIKEDPDIVKQKILKNIS